MRCWRSPLPTLLNLSLGLLLTLSLHACQPPPTSTAPAAAPNPQTETVANTAPPEPEPQPLPAATQAIVASAGTEGMFAPPRGDERLVVISDLNSAYGSTDYDPEIDKAIALLPFWQPDLVLCSGDMVAGQKLSLTNPQLEAMWAAFDDHVAAPLRQMNIPLGITMGNHDASSSLTAAGNFTFARERDVASAYWNAPDHDPGLTFSDRYQFPFYYTFTQNDIFVLVWDSSSFKIPADQLAWVEQALESPAAQAAKAKILLGHLPLYAVTEGRDKPGNVMANADQLHALLERHKVQTYISGHHHAYYPAHKGGVQLLNMGILGSGPRPYIGSSTRSPKSLTVIDVNYADPDLTTYTTYDMQTLALIELEVLPRSLNGHNGQLLRRDVSQDGT